jgi:hypothetical protein
MHEPIVAVSLYEGARSTRAFGISQPPKLVVSHLGCKRLLLVNSASSPHHFPNWALCKDNAYDIAYNGTELI